MPHPADHPGPRRPPRPRRGRSSPSWPSRSATRSSRPWRTTGGHLGSSLGVVELTIALHRLLESPRDRIVWDTGHQAYPHKLLTGRLERFGTLRQLDGIGGFPRRSESRARRLRRRPRRDRPVDRRGPGRGARPAPRPRADRGRRRRRGPDERAVARGAQRHRPAPDPDADRAQRQRDVDQPDGRRVLEVPVRDQAVADAGSRARAPTTGPSSGSRSSAAPSSSSAQRLRASVVQFAQPGQLFEDLGITYIGVVPGHDLHALLETLEPGPRRCRARRSSTSGPRRAAASGRPRPTRSASTVRPCRRSR